MATPATARGPAAHVPPYSALAPGYDLAVGVRDFLQTRAVFEALVRHHGLRFGSAADLGCGTGLFAAWLARRFGVPVYAVDLSPQMLAVARRNAAGARVTLLLQDLRRLRLPRPVALATANTCTLSHLLHPGDLARAFARIRQNLLPGGHLVFDLITPCQPWAAARGWERWLRVNGEDLLYRLRWDGPARLLRITIVHGARRPGPAQVELYLGKGYAPLEVARLLRAAGLEPVAIHDPDTLRPASGCPPRVVVVARRPAGA